MRRRASDGYKKPRIAADLNISSPSEVGLTLTLPFCGLILNNYKPLNVTSGKVVAFITTNINKNFFQRIQLDCENATVTSTLSCCVYNGNKCVQTTKTLCICLKDPMKINSISTDARNFKRDVNNENAKSKHVIKSLLFCLRHTFTESGTKSSWKQNEMPHKNMLCRQSAVSISRNNTVYFSEHEFFTQHTIPECLKV